MTNNMLIKDGSGVSKYIHTIEDSTSAHYNMSIPVDSAGNMTTVVSGSQPVAAGMGALVVVQRDGLPAGTNIIGKVSVLGTVSVLGVVSVHGGVLNVVQQVNNVAACSIGGGTSLIGSVSISPNGLNIPVSVANIPAVTQSGTWTVQPGNTANTTPWLVSVNSNIAVSVQNTLTVGTHAVTQSGTWTVQPGNTANTTPWLVSVNGISKVSIADSTLAVTQSGTWTVQPGNTANTTPWLVSVNGISKVSIADSTLAVTQSGTWTVQPGNTANTTPWLVSVNSNIAVSVQNALRPNTDKVVIGAVSVADSSIKTQDIPGTTGGSTLFSQMVSANTNGIVVKGGAGQLYGVHAFNILSTPLYLKFYNKATAPTVGTDVVVARYVIPGNTQGAGFSLAIPAGTPFSTGISLGITGGITDNNTTAPTADSAYINVYYA